MQNIWTIARKEYKHFFISPIAYVFMFVIFVIMGILFFVGILFASQSQQQYQYVPQINNLIQLFVFPLLFLGIPALTMRAMTDEYKSGTFELMLTSPVTDWQLIIGKWFGSFLFLMTTTVITLVYPLILNSLVTPGIDWKSLGASYLGITLFIAAVSALGVMISAFFTNQIASLFASLGALIFFWIVSVPAQLMQGVPAEVVKYLSIPTHFYETFLTGVIRVDDITYFVSLTVLALIIGSAAVEARRWR